mmetsp:Transcript_139635/g.243004  ORF Transcript_139635/g.243004 Transcript_139635/m.243004 type:complete len:298 (+) Transcript_139635:3129-4022(+)
MVQGHHCTAHGIMPRMLIPVPQLDGKDVGLRVEGEGLVPLGVEVVEDPFGLIPLLPHFEHTVGIRLAVHVSVLKILPPHACHRHVIHRRGWGLGVALGRRLALQPLVLHGLEDLSRTHLNREVDLPHHAAPAALRPEGEPPADGLALAHLMPDLVLQVDDALADGAAPVSPQVLVVHENRNLVRVCDLFKDADLPPVWEARVGLGGGCELLLAVNDGDRGVHGIQVHHGLPDDVPGLDNRHRDLLARECGPLAIRQLLLFGMQCIEFGLPGSRLVRTVPIGRLRFLEGLSGQVRAGS